MKKIVFVHSPIQAYLVKAMIVEGMIRESDMLVFHRGFKPDDALFHSGPGTMTIQGYALNRIDALLQVLSEDGPLEVVLPHSLCVAYHFAERLPSVKAISYLEEGTGTPFALKNHSHSGKTKQRNKNILQKAFRFISLVTSFGFSRLDLIRMVAKAEDLYNARHKDVFIDFESAKFKTIYGLSYWCERNEFYVPLHVGITAPQRLNDSVVIAIGKKESESAEYWNFLHSIRRQTEALGIILYSKLHPSIDRAVLFKKCLEAQEFLSTVTEYDPRGNELGFALIEEGFLGAISFFSSFQMYAHVAALEADVEFPMLCLEGLLGENDFNKKLGLLPEIGMSKNTYFSVEEWIMALSRKRALAG